MPLLLPGPGAAPQARLFCTFRLGAQRFGIDIADVKEVNTESALTRIPHAPEAVLGCVNLRGQIYLVLDLRQLLGLAPAQVGPDSRLLIFKPHVGDALAGLVDRIGDIVEVEEERIEAWRPGPDEVSPADELISSVARLPDNLLLILQAKGFLPLVLKAMKDEEV
jgi:purine-binding chemotaxis protein CheW